MRTEDPSYNSYHVAVTLGDIRKADALRLTQRISEIIETEFRDQYRTYGISASHVKQFVFGNRTGL